MPSLDAGSIAPAAREWLAGTRLPRVLHVFDRACNLINERREILSIVTRQAGNGPFNLVIGEDIYFSRHINLQSPISILPSALHLGDLTIHTAPAHPWEPRPAWEALRAGGDRLVRRVISLSGVDRMPDLPASLRFDLCAALAGAQVSGCPATARRLAGLGGGLTPSGDDYLVGAIHAAWLLHPSDLAERVGTAIADAAGLLTTSLSAAWLSAAARGEAGEAWHTMFTAGVAGDSTALRSAVQRVASSGHTSGADALAGFMGVIRSSLDRESHHVIPAHPF